MTTLLTIGAAAAAVAAVIGAVFAVVKLVRGVARVLRQIVFIADAVRELVPNGGTSLKDQVTRVDERQTQFDRRLTKLEDALGVKADG